MEPLSRFDAINISKIRVGGIGGLGLVAMAVVVSAYLPAARWAMTAGLLGGVVLAIGLVLARRVIKSKGPSGTDPTILFRAVPPEAREVEKGSRPADRELLTAAV